MAQMDKNMYRVGDFVYFESSPGAPYLIRRIDELNKMSTGNVEAKVACFYRRREIPKELLKIADKAERKKIHEEDDLKKAVEANQDDQNIQSDSVNDEKKTEDDNKGEDGSVKMEVDVKTEDEKNDTACETISEVKTEEKEESIGLGGLPTGAEKLDKQKIHALRCRELFFTRQCESIPAANIRGKCNVTLLSEVENPEDYLDKDDFFFYSLVYDAANMSLLADKGAIRVGDKYQATVEPWKGPRSAKKNREDQCSKDEDDKKKPPNVLHIPPTTDRETLVYHPHHTLSDKDIDQFLILSRAVGTFARAIDPTSSAKYPSVQMTAASASRDVTLLHAMALLHYGDYDIGKAAKYLIPYPDKDAYSQIAADKVTSCNTITLGGPVLCRDQFEEWSPYETNLFEEGMEKLGKDFGEIRQVCLGWKTMKDIIEYYYMWKTTNRYAEIKKKKNEEKDCKLKQVYVPSFSKPSPNLAHSNNNPPKKGTYKCESCENDDGLSYYNWGPSYLSLKICCECWQFWKKFGALKIQHPNELFDLDKKVSPDKNLPLPVFKSCPTIVGGKLTNIPSQIIAKLTPEQLAFYQAQLGVGNGTPNQNGTKSIMIPSKRASFLWKVDTIFKLGCKILTKQQLRINKLARSPCTFQTGLTHEFVITNLRDVIAKNPLIISKIIASANWRGSKNVHYQEILQVLAKRGVKRPAANDDDENNKEVKKSNTNV
uniref:BAH domain-containing protein n=1 Tax=Parastrongyloides trichosuri TaxID=131310 RepID=A0A0N4ZKK6_PARTI